MDLKHYGWNSFFEERLSEISEDGLVPGRVAIENKTNYLLYSEYGELIGEISGKMYFNCENKEDFPAVGDWVLFRPFPDEKRAIIEHVIPRKTKFSRKAAGSKTDEQILASNIDVVFIMTSMNQDLNVRRLERYLILARENKIDPVIVLSKCDLCESPEEVHTELNSFSDNVPILMISVITGYGLNKISEYLAGNKTIALLGSSGVGKSTLINHLAGSDVMKVNEITDYKDKGVHTTTRRELVLLPVGGMIIDTPGLRELQLWEGSEGLSDVFSDIESLAEGCKYKDCTHTTEPGCAVLKAYEDGSLDEERMKSYRKMQREINYFKRRQNESLILAERKKWKKIHKDIKVIYKLKNKQ